jgi:diguanylate cyclase (GGDEF)-like protein
MFSGSIWVTVFSVELVLYAVGTVFVIFMLVSERAVTVHKTAASMDPLTGMFNRRGFAEACSRVIEREANAGRPVTVMIFDIDHFKSINDRFGHPAGDEILKLFAAVVVNTLRISDLSGRIGGEEFAALLPCSLEEGVIVAERVREAFEVPESWSRTGRSIPPSASASPADRRAPSSRCCWRRPIPRSIRPSAAAAIASRRPRSCRCRWKTGGARPRASRVSRAAAGRCAARLGAAAVTPVYHSIHIMVAMDTTRSQNAHAP